MDDTVYTFNQTNRERKALVPSAAKRTNGSKSHKCTLPSDHLTPAQLRKLNGPVREYNITKPMSWEQFKEMPKDLQESYLSYLAQRFRVSTGTISICLFGKDRTHLTHYCNRMGLSYPVRSGKTSLAARDALTAWAQGADEREADPDVALEGLLSEDFEPDKPATPDEPVEPVSYDESDEPVVTDEPATRCPITSATLRMAGEAQDILDTLARFMGEGKVMVDVNITFIKEEN